MVNDNTLNIDYNAALSINRDKNSIVKESNA